jgi:hypothetical protein
LLENQQQHASSAAATSAAGALRTGAVKMAMARTADMIVNFILAYREQ